MDKILEGIRGFKIIFGMNIIELGIGFLILLGVFIILRLLIKIIHRARIVRKRGELVERLQENTVFHSFLINTLLYGDRDAKVHSVQIDRKYKIVTCSFINERTNELISVDVPYRYNQNEYIFSELEYIDSHLITPLTFKKKPLVPQQKNIIPNTTVEKTASETIETLSVKEVLESDKLFQEGQVEMLAQYSLSKNTGETKIVLDFTDMNIVTETALETLYHTLQGRIDFIMPPVFEDMYQEVQNRAHEV